MNLIICCTPLQVLIAEKIIDGHPSEIFYGIMIVPVENEKYEFYTKRLFSKCKKGWYFYTPSKNKIKLLQTWLKLRLKGLFIPRINKIFLANINSAPIHIFLSSLNFKSIATFDDGLGNLEGSITKETYHPLKSFVKKLCFCKYNVTSLMEKVTIHYSIYPRHPNIIHNVEYLNLYDAHFSPNFSTDPTDELKAEKILLGQPIYELNSIPSYTLSHYFKLLNHIFKELEITYYLPHPRERIPNIQAAKVQIIYTHKIFEDYFIDHFDYNKKYTIYTFFSSAVLSVSHLPNVKVIILEINDFPFDLSAAYDIFVKFNLPILKISQPD